MSRTQRHDAPSANDMPIGVFASDANGEMEYVNDAWCELTGLSIERSLGAGWLDALLDRDRDPVVERWRGCTKGQRPFRMELRIRRGDTIARTLVQTSLQWSADGDFAGMVGTITDVTSTRELEEELREIVSVTSTSIGERFFRSLVEHVARILRVEHCLVGEIANAPSGRLRTLAVWKSDRIAANFEVEVGESPFAGLVDDDVTVQLIRVELPGSGLPSEWAADSTIGVPIMDASRKVIGIVAVMHAPGMIESTRALDLLGTLASRAGAEIERIRGEHELQTSRNRYRTLFEDSPIGLWELDFSGIKQYVDGILASGVTDLAAWFDEHPEAVRECIRRIVVLDVNRASLELHEATDKEQLLAGLLPTFTESGIEDFKKEIVALATGDTYYESDCMATTVGGDPIHIGVKALVVPDEGAPLSRVLVSTVDLAQAKQLEEERLRLEARIQHAQKLESLGVLAGGIAHDFNNLLVGVLGNAQLLLGEETDRPPDREALLDIERAAKHATDLANQMLAYSGHGKFVIRKLNLAKLARETGSLLVASTSKTATLEFRLDDELPAVEGDAASLRQVVMNLVANASEAIGEEEGKIIVELNVREYTCDELAEFHFGHELAVGRYVDLIVSDNGCGMTQEAQERLFDPFFTTKFTGRGLGMAAVQGIVRAHDGAIRVESELGVGSRFQLLFPVADGPLDQETGSRSTRSASAPARNTILVVDDEQPVRNLTRRVLVKYGYDVVLAADGIEALSLYKANRESVGAVLLDMTMPRMDGPTTYAELMKIDPDVRVLLSSGYDEQEAWSRFEDNEVQFIQKPYGPDDLLAKLRSVM